MRFKIGVTFTGIHRMRVFSIVNALLNYGFTKDEIFYDDWHDAYINGIDADIELGKIYSQYCDFIVVFLSEEYNTRSWTRGVEWRTIRKIINVLDGKKICLLNVDSVDINNIDGLSSNTDIAKDIKDLTAEEVAEFILKRYEFVFNHIYKKHSFVMKESIVNSIPISPCIIASQDDIYALCCDGTILSTKFIKNDITKAKISQIIVGNNILFCLKDDGRILHNYDHVIYNWPTKQHYQVNNFLDWKNIKQISLFSHYYSKNNRTLHTVMYLFGLKFDGKIIVDAFLSSNVLNVSNAIDMRFIKEIEKLSNIKMLGMPIKSYQDWGNLELEQSDKHADLAFAAIRNDGSVVVVTRSGKPITYRSYDLGEYHDIVECRFDNKDIFF